MKTLCIRRITRTVATVAASLSLLTLASAEEEAVIEVEQDEPPIVEGLAHYVVYSQPQQGMIQYSTFQFPELGYVRTEPDLLVTNFADVTLNKTRIVTKDQPRQPMQAKVQNAISIQLTEEDAAKLQALTKETTGQRVLIVIDGRPVTAPVIMAPIESGEVTISGGRLSDEAAAGIVTDLKERVLSE